MNPQRRLARGVGFVLLGALCLTLEACASPVRAVRVDRTVAHRDLSRSVVTTGEASWATRDVLLERGLFDTFRDRPEVAIAELHRAMVAADGDQDLLFALAELSFLHGEATKKPEYRMAAAVYAYAFLFPEDGGSRPGPLDPRLRIAADLYNWALTAAFASQCAQRHGLIESLDTLTVIDYSRPSTTPRLWVLDLRRHEVVHQELVAHGRGSGENHAGRFSNDPGSHQSSLGLFVALDTYAGQHGRSLRLAGLEPGVNDRALERGVVIHGAAYVSPAFAASHGRLGLSWGCPALDLHTVQRVIDRIRGGTPVFVYYPDQSWLGTSSLLGDCGAPHSTASR